MRIKFLLALLAMCFVAHAEGPAAAPAAAPAAHDATTAKPTADEVLKQLADGNARFRDGKTLGTHRDIDRVKLAATSDQGNYATATVLSCSDSRVPVEIVFDAGVMDLFVVRVAGNVADTDEVGSIEYGLCHVNTPLLVVLGHSGCGAVTAVAQALQGKGHPLEKSIPPLVDNIAPAVQRAMKAHPEAKDAAIVPYGVEENVWQSVRDLFKRSAAVRELVTQGKAKVVGAIYDLPTGEVKWLDAEKPKAILASVEKDPKRSMDAFAGQHAPALPATAATTPAKPADSPPEAPKPPAAPHAEPQADAPATSAPEEKH